MNATASTKARTTKRRNATPATATEPNGAPAFEVGHHWSRGDGTQEFLICCRTTEDWEQIKQIHTYLQTFNYIHFRDCTIAFRTVNTRAILRRLGFPDRPAQHLKPDEVESLGRQWKFLRDSPLVQKFDDR